MLSKAVRRLEEKEVEGASLEKGITRRVVIAAKQ